MTTGGVTTMMTTGGSSSMSKYYVSKIQELREVSVDKERIFMIIVIVVPMELF